MGGKTRPFRQAPIKNIEAQPPSIKKDSHGKAKPYRPSGGIDAVLFVYFFFPVFSGFGLGGGPKSP